MEKTVTTKIQVNILERMNCVTLKTTIVMVRLMTMLLETIPTMKIPTAMVLVTPALHNKHVVRQVDSLLLKVIATTPTPQSILVRRNSVMRSIKTVMAMLYWARSIHQLGLQIMTTIRLATALQPKTLVPNQRDTLQTAVIAMIQTIPLILMRKNYATALIRTAMVMLKPGL